MSEPLTDEQHTAIRQRIADVIRPSMLIGLQDAELHDEPGRERINEWADSIATWAAEAVQPELDRLRQHVEELQDKLLSFDDNGKCCCSFDGPGDVCLVHSPTVQKLRAELADERATSLERAREADERRRRAETAEERVAELTAVLRPTEDALTRVLRAAEAMPVEVRRWVHDAIDDRGDGPAGHVYLSTSCFHGEHGYCQGATGAVGPKEPAKCKFCPAPCRCACHAAKRTA